VLLILLITITIFGNFSSYLGILKFEIMLTENVTAWVLMEATVTFKSSEWEQKETLFSDGMSLFFINVIFGN
jgi:hypothetical protein